MKEFDNIKESLLKDEQKVTNLQQLEELKITYLGKKGLITELQKGIREALDKKSYGEQITLLRNMFNEFYEDKKRIYEEEILNNKLENEKIDITIPSTRFTTGSPNILEKVIEDIEEIYMSMGYDVYEGNEVEEDKYNFELLNIPKGHPARDAQDTFYLEGNEILLRSQTSGMQAHVLEEFNGSSPVRMICPGKTYRRDNDDATHSHQFTQIEGLLVDKNVSLSDLTGTIDLTNKKLFGNDTVTRFRPSYYQFTEPSVEFDISCFSCKGKGCSICKHTGWITIGGAGMVHPNVLRMNGYDPKEWRGFAFGYGAERCAMIKYGINDIRIFYNTDLREISNFDRWDGEEE